MQLHTKKRLDQNLALETICSFIKHKTFLLQSPKKHDHNEFTMRFLKLQKGFAHILLIVLALLIITPVITILATNDSRTFDFITGGGTVSTPCSQLNCPPDNPSTPSAPVNKNAKHPINWSTPQVSLSAKDFYIKINSKKYVGVQSINVHSDPGSKTRTTLEAEWMEDNVPMRLNIYFEARKGKWYVTEVRTYNGNKPGDWIYYDGFKGKDLGKALKDSKMKVENKRLGSKAKAEIYFKDLILQPFLK